MKKIISYFVIGFILLVTGIVIAKFGEHRHMSKGMILGFIGFILTGASGLTLLQSRKFLFKKKKSDDLIDRE